MLSQSHSGPGSTGARAGVGRVFAIAHHTFREALRSRVFLLLVLLGLIAIGSAQFFPAMDLTQRFKLVQSVCLGASAFFVTALAILLAASSIPRDLEEKYAYTVLAKPVSRVIFMWGKMLGFALVLGLMLGIMWLFTVAFTRMVLGHGKLMVSLTDPDGPAAAAGIRVGDVVISMNGRRFADPYEAELYARDIPRGELVTMKLARGGQIQTRVILSGSRKRVTNEALIESLGLDLRSISGRGEKRLPPARMVFQGGGGLERQGKVVSMGDLGGGPDFVTVVFANVPRENLPTGDLRVLAYFDMWTTDVGRYGAEIKMAAYDPSARSWVRFDHFMVARTETTLFVPRQAMGDDGTVQLRIYRDEAPLGLTMGQESFQLMLRARPMELNLLASYSMLFAQVILVAVIACAASTFLSAYVATLLAFSVYLVGNLTEFIRMVAAKLIEGAYRLPGHYHGELDVSAYFPRWYDPVVGWIARGFSWLVPDFRKFDSLAQLVASQSVSGYMMVDALCHLLIYGGFAFVVGSLIISRREVA